ncbi:hypothetical protein [Clostridium sp. 'deep sea']|uniref:hypothetical protein n=1 Tax=Clostridium sp. 'deep sea' TaxID=2779445 RepID=UPI001A9BAFA0|nr:hypothetical protein [Clostridium sp. 'deep sea']
MKNTLGDLNNHLFAQLERLSDEDLTGESLREEIGRAKAVNDVATRIIANGKLVLEGQKFMDGRMDANAALPKMLTGVKEELKSKPNRTQKSRKEQISKLGFADSY